nr:hypothetical protein HannXRQ_Chr10g0317871 [Ipomoea trifida]
MCYHQCYELGGLRDLAAATTRLQRRHVSDESVRRRAEDSGNGGGGEPLRRCLCSPTTHPGSFRCRYHVAAYVWGRRVIRGSS